MKKLSSLILLAVLLLTACATSVMKTPPQLLSNAKPAYPIISMQNSEQGKVEVEVKITAAGKVAVAKVVQSSGFERLDNAAFNVVTTKYQFKPALDEKGKAVKSRVIIPFSFELEK